MAEGLTPKTILSAGDTMPGIVLPDARGTPIDTTDQLIAGQTHVFWLCGGRPSAETVILLNTMAPVFTALEAQVFVIAGEAPDVTLSQGIHLMLDRDSHVLRGLGLTGPAITVCDPRGKLSAILSGDGFPAAMELCSRIFASSAPAVLQTAVPVMTVPGVLEPDFCAALIGHWENGAKTVDAVAHGARQADIARSDVKRRSDVMIRDRDLLDGLQRRLQARLLPEISRAYRFDVMKMEPPRIGCYAASEDGGGFFRRHRDNRTKFTAHRGFALTLNLNTGDYAGGQLRFPEFGREVYAPPRGGAIVFSCNLLHEVMPVTTGRRFAVVSFFSDAAGAAQEERLIAAERAAGRNGISIGL